MRVVLRKDDTEAKPFTLSKWKEVFEMKRFLILFIILSITVIPCFAESVTIRGGITFLTSKEDIIRFEDSQGTEYEVSPTNYGDYFTDNCIYCKNVSVAGYDNCSEIYYFNEEDVLESVLYLFEMQEESKELADRQFEVLDNALSKYGPTIGSGNEYIRINEAIDVLDYFSSSRFNNEPIHSSELKAFSQRLAEDDNGYIDIKLIEFHHIMDVSNKAIGINMKLHYYPLAISYTYCSSDQVNAVKAKAREKQNALNNDL